MLAIVSPAKKIDFSEVGDDLPHTQPDFIGEAEDLAGVLRKLSRTDLQRLMKISDPLTELNFQRFKAFKPPFTLSNAKQAVLAFSGDTYVGLEAKSLSREDLEYAQDHLVILSGLYGALRPLDLIQAYRLEMGTRLKNPGGADLYDFWGNGLTDAIDKRVENHKDPVVVNLASNEYFKAVKPKDMKARIITPVFKEVKGDVAKVLGLFAKRARGMMARYIITERLEDTEDLKSFSAGGYTYQDHLSDEDTWVYTRPQPAKK